MNTIKEIDILDKSKLALNNLFRGELAIFDKEISLSENNTITTGTLFFNGIEFSFIVLARPTIGKIVSLFNRKTNPLQNNIYILDYASEEMINFLRSHDMFFVDTAGNCFVNLPELKISIEGKKKIWNTPPENKVAFQKTGLKLIFQLLLRPVLAHQSFRKISEITNISIASISAIFEELKEDGFIVEIKKNRRNLSNIKRLIRKWAISYTEVLRPKIHRGYFKSMNNNSFNYEIINSIHEDLYLGGEYGTYLLNRSINPQKLILYTNSRLSDLVRKYKILPTSKLKEDIVQIEILEVFWNEDISIVTKSKSNQTISDPILIYADLMNSNNYRSRKAAKELLNNEIRTRFIQYNF